MGNQESHGNVESQRLNKFWKPRTFLFLANELNSVPKVVQQNQLEFSDKSLLY